MTKIDNCSSCIHKDVCIQRPIFTSYVSKIEDVPPLSSITLAITCKHFKNKPRKSKTKEVTSDGKEPV